MLSEDTPSYDRENPAEEHRYFDELAKGLADAALSRGWVLTLAEAALLGGLLSAAFPGVAQARRKSLCGKGRG